MDIDRITERVAKDILSARNLVQTYKWKGNEILISWGYRLSFGSYPKQVTYLGDLSTSNAEADAKKLRSMGFEAWNVDRSVVDLHKGEMLIRCSGGIENVNKSRMEELEKFFKDVGIEHKR